MQGLVIRKLDLSVTGLALFLFLRYNRCVFNKQVHNGFCKQIFPLDKPLLHGKTTELFQFPYFRRRGSDIMFMSSGYLRILPVFVCGFFPPLKTCQNYVY